MIFALRNKSKMKNSELCRSSLLNHGNRNTTKCYTVILMMDDQGDVSMEVMFELILERW